VPVDEGNAQLLGRMAAIEFALGAIIKRLPDEVRQEVQRDLWLFIERIDTTNGSGQAVAEAGRSILKEAGIQLT